MNLQKFEFQWRLLEKIFDSGKNAILRTSLLDSVKEMAVETSVDVDVAALGSKTRLTMWVTVRLRYSIRVVVEVAATIWPSDIVQKDDWIPAGIVFCQFLQSLQLVKNGVPVVVTINEDQVSVAD